MPREKRADEIARELAPEPSEPLYTRRTSLGIVKHWRDDKGYGVIASDDTAPWDIWCHFGAIERQRGMATLPSGERLEATYDDDGRAYSPTDEQVVSGYIEHAGLVSLRAGERVEVIYYRADHSSFKYVAKHVRRIEPPSGAA